MLEVEKGNANPADVDDDRGQRKEDEVEKEGGSADVDETEEEPSSGVEREDGISDKPGDEGGGGSDDDEDQDVVHDVESKNKKKKKKRKSRSDKKPVSSTSLLSEKSSKEKKTKKKKKKKEKDDTDEKAEQNEKKKKTQKKEKKKKKKGDSKKKLVSLEQNDEDNMTNIEKEKDNDQLDESKADEEKETSRSSSGKGGKKSKKNEGDNDNTTTGDFSTATRSHASISTDDSKINKFIMTSLRRNEKARGSQGIENTYDSDDDGLWAGTAEDTPRTSGSKAASNGHKKKKRKKKSVGNRRDKSEWESSVAADDSIPVYLSDYSDEDMSYRDYSNRSMFSDTSDHQPSSFRSNGRSHRSLSGRSHRSISVRSHRTISGTSFTSASGRPESTTFRSLKQDRNTGVKRSIHEEEEPKDTFSVSTQDKSDQKPLSRVDLRKDLEAQARQHVEKRSSNQNEKFEILALLKQYTQKSVKRLSSVFEASSLDLKGVDLEDEIESNDEEKGNDSEESEEKDKQKNKNDGDKKLTRQQKWIAFKEKARSRKGYIVIISIVVALLIVANIILGVYLAK